MPICVSQTLLHLERMEWWIMSVCLQYLVALDAKNSVMSKIYDKEVVILFYHFLFRVRFETHHDDYNVIMAKALADRLAEVIIILVLHLSVCV